MEVGINNAMWKEIPRKQKKHCRERENVEKLMGKGETWSQKSRSYGPPLAVGQRRQSPLKGSKKAVWSPREEDCGSAQKRLHAINIVVISN